jgi:hypothetical protein
VYISGRRLEPLQAAAEGFKARFGSKKDVGSIVPVQADLSTKEGIVGEYMLLLMMLGLTIIGFRAEIEKEEKWVNILINSEVLVVLS